MISDAEVTRTDIAARVAKDFAALTPLVRWLNGALGLKPAKRR
jgi:hypothetical protein